MGSKNKEKRKPKSQSWKNHRNNKGILYSDAFGWFLALLVFVLPLCFNPLGYNMFDPLRFFMLVSVTFLLLCLALLSFLRMGKAIVPRTSLELPIAVLLVALVLSTITSVHPRTSILGEFNQYEGLITWFCYLALFYLSYLFLRKRRTVSQFIMAISISASFISIYGIFQHYGYDFMQWGPGAEVARSGSSFGNPCFLGAFIVLVIPLTITSAFCRDVSHRLRVVSGLASILMFIALLFTLTRAAWLAFFVSIVFLLILNRRSIMDKYLPNRNYKKIWMITTVILVLLVAGLLIIPGSSPYLDRLKSAFDIQKGSSNMGRLILWKHTLPLIAQRPVFGWGTDTLSLVFPEFMTPQFEQVMSRKAIANDAHNRFLQILATSGLIVLIAYLWLIVMLFRRIIPRALDSSDIFERNLIQGLSVGCLAYLIQLMFNASLLPADAIFWIFAGASVWFSLKQEKVEEREIQIKWSINKEALTIGTALTLVIAVISVGFIFGRRVIADYYLRNAFEAKAGGDIDASLDLLKRATSLDSDEYYLVELGKLYSEVAIQTGKKAYFCSAISAFVEAREINPLDEASYYHLGNTYLAAGDRLNQRTYFKDAQQNFEKVISEDPNYADCHLKLGIVYAKLGQDRKAIGEWKQVTILAPDSIAAYYNIGNYYKEIGKKDKAVDYLRKGLEIDASDQRLKDALRDLESQV